MKIILILFFATTLSLSCLGQQEKTRAKYRIKVVAKDYVVTRGIFYAVADDGITLVTAKGDTVKLAADKISSLFIRRRGVIASLIIIPATIFVLLALQVPKSDFVNPEGLAVVAAFLGAGVGYVSAEFFSAKKYYKKIETKDFPDIKNNLQQYAEIK